MYKFSKDTEIDFEAYENELRRTPYILYNRKLMENILKYEECRSNTLASLAVDVMIHNSSGSCYSLQKNVILTYLLEYENCPVRYFNNKKTEGLSLDSKKVLEKLVLNGHATDFLGYYREHKSLISKNGKVKGIIARNCTSGGVNKDGIELSKLWFGVNQQKNFRYNYSNEDIIAIPKEYNHCISVEKDYFLAWGDFGQSDFRIAYNLFMRSPENDKIMNAYDDKYEALARMISSLNNQTFDIDKFKEERQLYKRLTLATVYGTRNSVVPQEQPFIKRLTDFLFTCDKYCEYVERLNDRIELGLPIIVDSYFGNEQMIEGKYRAEDLLNDALNAPVQTGTSEIVALTTMAILEEFRKLGYTEDDISVYYVRHDEPIFRVHKRVLKDTWVFNQFNQIIIDDWTPLRMDFDFGYYYKEKDEDLQSTIENIYENNKHKIAEIPIGNTINNFYPVPPVFNLTLAKNETPDGKTVYSFYCDKLKAAQHNILHTAVENETDYVISIIAKIEEQIYKKGFRGISVKSNFLPASEAFVGNSYVGFQLLNNNDLSKVIMLSRYAYCCYCKQQQLNYDSAMTPLKSDEAFIKSVKELTVALGE